MATTCDHCGEPCGAGAPHVEDKLFCCEGCKLVYTLLNGHGLKDYYRYNDRPGINRRAPVREDKFAFLDEERIASRLISFRSDTETHIQFYLPRIHCSSCLYLLENLRRLHGGILSCRVDFAARKVYIVFNPARVTLREVAGLLATIGYEPWLSLEDLDGKRPGPVRTKVYQLGVAGFCFGNIMLLSFPEYLGLGVAEAPLRGLFRLLNLGLALPVVLFSAQPFFVSAWKALRQRYLNIDAPIALAILVTFIRSTYEVLSVTGSGYFDSLSGIVFFMLAGRMLQDRTYRQLSFERDYRAYFPIAVTALQGDKVMNKTLPEVCHGDTLLIHPGELIPADAILTRGQASIDYSFVTGESLPVPKETGELLYAGGRQTGAAIEVLVIKEVAQSYLTQLWEREEFRQKATTEGGVSFVTLLSRYFTYIVLAVAAGAGVYWHLHDPARVWGAVTAVLIIACPCALLLSSTFTNGNILRILARHHFYLRHAQVIERVAATTRIVFDKTGTLTVGGVSAPDYAGEPLGGEERKAITALAAQSTHPLSRALAASTDAAESCRVLGYSEVPGQGISAWVDGRLLRMGSAPYVTGGTALSEPGGSRVYVAFDGCLKGSFSFANHYREGIRQLVRQLPRRIRLSVLSGDGDQERARLLELLGDGAELRFRCRPQDKSDHIRTLQGMGEKVMMIGDGLNDAAALRQANTGIALSEASGQFTPASDAILEAGELSRLPAFIRLCRANRRIIELSFVISILYNVIGLYFAVQGQLSPLVAAVLMPASSLSILLITYGSSNLAARWLKL
ncbi:MAG TPA: heavy metal translocating P-type ATPase metal-binding domain-containing protein [Puia sp.]|nr:heavy metal translocating P-type ATPase metal-binding domain-containing protein [Puia sp.]